MGIQRFVPKPKTRPDLFKTLVFITDQELPENEIITVREVFETCEMDQPDHAVPHQSNGSALLHDDEAFYLDIDARSEDDSWEPFRRALNKYRRVKQSAVSIICSALCLLVFLVLLLLLCVMSASHFYQHHHQESCSIANLTTVASSCEDYIDLFNQLADSEILHKCRVYQHLQACVTISVYKATNQGPCSAQEQINLALQVTANLTSMMDWLPLNCTFPL